MSGIPAAPAPVAAALPEGSVPSAEYAASMLAATHGDPAPAVVAAGVARPDHIPEQFWDAASGKANVEEMGKAYAALRAKMDAGPAAAPAAEPAPVVDPAADPLTSAKIAAPVVASPMAAAFDTFAAAFEAGEDQAPSIANLEALGIPRKYIDQYLQGLPLIQANGMKVAYDAAGGEAQFGTLTSWASTSLSDADMAYFNDNCDGPNRAQAVEWLASKYAAANPSEGTLVEAQASASSGDVFTSTAQMTASMQSPLYKTDPAYRQQVAEKVARSVKAGSLDTGATFHR